MKRKTLLTLISVFFLCLDSAVAQESRPFLFLFQRGSDLLVGNYGANSQELEALRQNVNANRAAIKQGQGHYRIVSFVMPCDSADFAAINNASVQGSVVRSWLIKRHKLSSNNSTFYIDRRSGFDNRVEVAYVDSPVAANASQTINYTMSRKDRAKVDMAVSRYNPVPFLDMEFAANSPQDKSGIKNDVVERTTDSATPAAKTDRTDNVAPQVSAPQTTVTQEQTTTPAVSVTQQPSKEKLFPTWALKTNLLLFAGVYPDFRYYVVTPNIEAEYYFARRWSVGADFAYAVSKLSDTDTKERFGYHNYAAEGRYWFKGDCRFRGFYAGIYAAYTEFNLMDPDRYDGFGYSGDMYSAGLSAGYVAPLSRRLFLEVGLRGGYAYADYEKYHHDGSGFISNGQGNDSNFRLQAVRVSLMYRFGGKK